MSKHHAFINNRLLDKRGLVTKVLDLEILHVLYKKSPKFLRAMLTEVKYRILVPIILFPRHYRYSRAIASSGLFWDTYYCKHYPDVLRGTQNALQHYISFGWAEKRDPNPYFCTWWYLENNPDVERTGVNPLYHYIVHGWKEGRDPGPYFSIQKYRALNPDVCEHEPLSYFLSCGLFNGPTALDPPCSTDFSMQKPLKKFS